MAPQVAQGEEEEREGEEPHSLLDQHKAKLAKKSKKELKVERKRAQEEEQATKEERLKQVGWECADAHAKVHTCVVACTSSFM